MDLFAELEARGLVQDSTDREALAARLASGPIGVYVGFDPTADSLHVGHLLGQLTLRRLQLAGHRPFPLAGGATGMVGDPGGRSEERNLLDRETLDHNIAAIKVQLERLLDFEPGPLQATLVDNADWTAPIGVLDFLRDVGKHMTVNQMVAKDSVRHRMESEHGISYTEFSYMLLQANDFRYLCEHHDVELQMGGSDQWGNITTGIDLIRRTLGRTAHGLTWPLLTLPGRRQDGQDRRRRGVARPRQDLAVPVPPVLGAGGGRGGRRVPPAAQPAATGRGGGPDQRPRGGARAAPGPAGARRRADGARARTGGGRRGGGGGRRALRR